MATDNAEPRNARILGFTVASIVTFVVTLVGLNSYFITMTEAEAARHSNDPRATALRAQLHTEAAGHLTAIDNAMAQVANGARPGSIEPRPSTDWSALNGWGLAPANLHVDGLHRSSPMPVAPTPATAAPAPAPATPAPAAQAAPAAPMGNAPPAAMPAPPTPAAAAAH